MGGFVLEFGLLCPADTISLPLPSHAAGLGQPGIPSQCHRGCGTGPDLPSRHYGKSHSQIPGQGMVYGGGGWCNQEPRGTLGMGYVAEGAT